MVETSYNFFTSAIDSLFERANVSGNVWFNNVYISRETPLYRYTSLSNLLQILEGTIYFSTRKAFSDRREQGEYQSPLLKLTHSNNILLGRRNDFYQIKNDAFKQSEDFFVSCWSLTSEESFPMWRAYTRDRYGVRLGSTLGNILDSINFSNCHRAYISPVTYGEEKSLNSPMDILFYKTNGYNIENEVRIYAIVNKGSNNQMSQMLGYEFSLNPKLLLKEFSFSPFLSPREQCMIANVLFSRYEWLQEIVTPSSIMEY